MTRPKPRHSYKKSGRVDWSSAIARPAVVGEPRVLSSVGRVLRMFDAHGNFVHVPQDVRAFANAITTPRCELDGVLTASNVFHALDVLNDEGPEARRKFVSAYAEADLSGAVVAVDWVKVRSDADLMVCHAEFVAAGLGGALLTHDGADGYLVVDKFVTGEFSVCDFKTVAPPATGTVFVCRGPDGEDFDVRSREEWSGPKAGRILVVAYVPPAASSKCKTPLYPVPLRWKDADRRPRTSS